MSKILDQILNYKVYLRRGKVLLTATPAPTGYQHTKQLTRRVLHSKTMKGYTISTVEFLYPSLVPGEGICFETLVTASDGSQNVVGRYPSKQRAKKGHRVLERELGGKVLRVRGGKF